MARRCANAGFRLVGASIWPKKIRTVARQTLIIAAPIIAPKRITERSTADRMIRRTRLINWEGYENHESRHLHTLQLDPTARGLDRGPGAQLPAGASTLKGWQMTFAREARAADRS